MKWKNPSAGHTGWQSPIKNRIQKEKVVAKLAKRLKNGDIVGAGSGSTSYLALLALANQRDREGLDFKVIPTSIEIEMICAALSIATTDLKSDRPDWSFDGADEVDSNNNLIKGRGGAMLREKLVIAASPEAYIVVDSSKRVKRLGQNFAVPVEVYPDAVQLVETALQKFKNITGIVLRQADTKDGPVITENGNLILDVRFSHIPPNTEQKLRSIVGVVETGLFMSYPVKII